MNSNELTTNFDLLTRKKCKYKQAMMCCVKNAWLLFDFIIMEIGYDLVGKCQQIRVEGNSQTL